MSNAAPPAPAPGDPVVHLYTICWNEAAMLPFFFRHYDPVVSRYVFYDDGSTDGTLDLLAAHPRVEIRRFQRVIPDSYVLSAQELHNAAWKDSRGQADWVIWTAVDEHLHHASLGLKAYIRACHDSPTTVVPALGFQMVGNGFPPPGTLLCERLPMGAPHLMFCKLSLFRPEAVREMNYSIGRHAVEPVGILVYPETDALLLLHYKYLERQYTAARNALLAKGLGPLDDANAWGSQYRAEAAVLDAEFEMYRSLSLDTSNPAILKTPGYPYPAWWRYPPFA